MDLFQATWTVQSKWIPREAYSRYAKSLTQTVGCGVAKYSPG